MLREQLQRGHILAARKSSPIGQRSKPAIASALLMHHASRILESTANDRNVDITQTLSDRQQRHAMETLVQSSSLTSSNDQSEIAHCATFSPIVWPADEGPTSDRPLHPMPSHDAQDDLGSSSGEDDIMPSPTASARDSTQHAQRQSASPSSAPGRLHRKRRRANAFQNALKPKKYVRTPEAM
jgi:hypothetical protein